jgi:hypothetical protein
MNLPLIVEFSRAQSLNSCKRVSGESVHIVIESMGDEYNNIGEEYKSIKKYKERKSIWVGDQILRIHLFA